MATLQTKPDKKIGGVKAYAVTSVIKNGLRKRQWLYLGTYLTKREAEREFNRVSDSFSRERVREIHQSHELSKTIPTLEEYTPTFKEYVMQSRAGIDQARKDTGLRLERRPREFQALPHVLRHIRKMKIDALTLPVIREYVTSRMKETSRITGKAPSPSTVRQEVMLLSSICAQAVLDGKIERHPFAVGVKLGKLLPTVFKKRKGYLSHEELQDLQALAEENPFTATVLLLLASSGARVGEVVSVKLHDCDTQRRVLTLISWKTARSKGQEALATREVPIPSILLPVIEKLKTHRLDPNGSFVPRLANQEFLLCDKNGLAFESGLGRSLERLGKKLGIKKRIGRHIFRHTWASWARQVFGAQEAESILGQSPLINRGYGGTVTEGVRMESGKARIGMGILEKMDILMELMGLQTPEAYIKDDSGTQKVDKRVDDLRKVVSITDSAVIKNPANIRSSQG